MYFSHLTEQSIFQPLNFNGRDANSKIHIGLDKRANFVAHIYAINSEGIMCNASWKAENFFSRFPERKTLTRAEAGSHICIPSTDVSVQILSRVWPKDKIFFDDDAKIIYVAKLFDIDSASIVARQTSEWVADKKVPKHNLILHTENPLTCYQQVAAVNTGLSDGYGLLMDMGTGKTAVVVTHICNESMKPKYDNKMLTAIVVCPPALCLNWQEEFHKFGVAKGQVSILRGTACKRIETWVCGLVPHSDDNRYNVYIIPYDSMCNMWEYLKKTPNGFDIAILDESHLMANTATRRYKFCTKLRDISRQRLALTGTPIRNNALDLYALFEFLGEGLSGFRSQKNFKSFYGVYEKAYNDDGHDKFIGIQNAPFIKERLARHTYSITKKEALPDLPDKLYDIHEVQMTSKQLKYYKKLASKLVLEIEHTMGGNTMNSSMVVEHVLTKLLRLAQVTSGFLVFSPEIDELTGEVLTKRKEVQIFSDLKDNPKISALLDLLKDKGPDDKTIVWACFRPDIQNITQALSDAGIDSVEYYGDTSTKKREANVKRFNCDPKCTVLVGNPSAGGIGLNLLGYDPNYPDAYTTNCSHIIYYSQNWSYVVRDQSESRPHRRGTRMPVRVTDLSVPDTIDTEIRERVMDKKKHALDIMDIDDLLRKLL